MCSQCIQIIPFCGVSRDYWLAVGNSYEQFQHSKMEVCILLLASTIFATRRHHKVIPRFLTSLWLCHRFLHLVVTELELFQLLRSGKTLARSQMSYLCVLTKALLYGRYWSGVKLLEVGLKPCISKKPIERQWCSEEITERDLCCRNCGFSSVVNGCHI